MTLRLRNRWKYAGDERWDWGAFLDDGGSGELAGVAYVEYVLHPTFRPSVVKVTDPKDGFVFRTNGWGEFQLTAFVYGKDGSKRKLQHGLQLAYDPVQGVSV